MTPTTLIVTDTETQGLTPSVTCQAIEVACVLFDVASASVIESFSSLIRADANPCYDINRISVDSLAKAPHPDYVWQRVTDMVTSAGPLCAYVAHRAEFDRGFYPALLAGRLPWICSKQDVSWPLSKPGESCVGMALAHGVPVVSAHRAMTDAMLIVRTLERVVELGHDLPAILARAMRPRALFMVADTSFDAARNELAKQAGFAWDNATRRWTKRIALDDVGSLPFAVKEVAA
jgi:DNA polymerase III subunit epsilon